MFQNWILKLNKRHSSPTVGRFTKKIYLSLKNNTKRNKKAVLLKEENGLQEIVFDYILFTVTEVMTVEVICFILKLVKLCTMWQQWVSFIIDNRTRSAFTWVMMTIFSA